MIIIIEIKCKIIKYIYIYIYIIKIKIYYIKILRLVFLLRTYNITPRFHLCATILAVRTI